MTPVTTDPSPPPSPAFASAFRARAASRNAAGGVLAFDDFMDLALYHPEFGYYRRPDRSRVGRSAETDFYTSTSSGPLFGELICAACVKLLGPDADLRHFTFVEIGAEPGGGILRDVAHPFARALTLRVGEPLALGEISRGNPLIVFSNELFDAQPFRRFVTRDAHWRERGVALSNDDRLCEIELPADASAALPGFVSLPPAEAFPDGYQLDLPVASAALARQLAAQTWPGLFIACDYGKSWRELVEATPQGTARAYFHHQQSADLLARPGDQDLTCHICWDWLVDALAQHGFRSPLVESQEAFLVHHAGHFIAGLTAAEAAGLSPRKRSLMQLLHPANMGQKFQVLHAFRE